MQGGAPRATAKAKLQRFRTAVRAIHLRPTKSGWEFFQIGGKPVQFAEKTEALKAAKKAATEKNLPVLVHQAGHVAEVS